MTCHANPARLAVQQAQSAHAIKAWIGICKSKNFRRKKCHAFESWKAIHPLFFEWTGDTYEQMLNDERVWHSSRHFVDSGDFMEALGKT